MLVCRLPYLTNSFRTCGLDSLTQTNRCDDDDDEEEDDEVEEEGDDDVNYADDAADYYYKNYQSLKL